MHHNYTIINEDKSGQRATMTLTGYVSSYNSDNTFNASKFIEAFNALKAKYKHIHIDIVNLYGGSIVEGIPVYNHIKETAESGDIKITGKIEGLAASMGSIISMAIPVDDLEMGNMARLMNHRAKGGAWGTAEEIKNAADMIQGYEDDMISILAQRTGLPDADVKAKWMDGLDHYIKATEAKKLKLVGKVTKTEIKKPLPKNFSNPEEAYNFFETHLVHNSLNNDMELEKQLREALNLGVNDDVLAAVKQLQIDATFKPKFEALNNANKQAQETEAQTLVQKAIDGKHIDEAQKDVYLNLFKADHANAKTVLESVMNTKTTAPTASQQLGKMMDGLGAGAPKAEVKDWDWYEKNDPDTLLAMQESNPTEFKKLFDEKYN